jgi:hypothetical protein
MARSDTSTRDDVGGEIIEHVAGVDDFEIAQATYAAAVRRWPAARIMLRQGARTVHDSGQRQ